MHTYSSIYIKIYQISLHVSAHTAPSTGRTLLSLAQKNSAYCDIVTLVIEHKTNHMWVLQCYLQLLEQYLAFCNQCNNITISR